MQKNTWTWITPRLPAPARLAGWGHFGTPVLLFPTAGGDFEEVERFHLISALSPLIDAGRVKVYSVDGLAARTWLSGVHSLEHCVQVQSLYDAYIAEEVVPHIQRDCHSDDKLEIIVAGVAIGAFHAVATLCRYPDTFRLAIAMSGTFELSKYLRSAGAPEVVPYTTDDALLRRAQQRFVLLPTGEGDYEQPEETHRLAAALSTRGIPHRVDLWGRDYHHGWNTWRTMLPKYLADALAG